MREHGGLRFTSQCRRTAPCARRRAAAWCAASLVPALLLFLGQYHAHNPRRPQVVRAYLRNVRRLPSQLLQPGARRRRTVNVALPPLRHPAPLAVRLFRGLDHDRADGAGGALHPHLLHVALGIAPKSQDAALRLRRVRSQPAGVQRPIRGLTARLSRRQRLRGPIPSLQIAEQSGVKAIALRRLRGGRRL